MFIMVWIIVVEKGLIIEFIENGCWVFIGDGIYLIFGFYLVLRYIFCLVLEIYLVIIK